MKDQQRSGRSLEMGTTRVEAFSDGVMAVIITIMALELRAPRGATLDAVREQLPGLLVYLLSFVMVGIYWNNHHHLLRAADRVSGAAMWANLFLLFWLSLIPVLTEWLRDEYRHPLPAAAYGTVALAAGSRTRSWYGRSSGRTAVTRRWRGPSAVTSRGTRRWCWTPRGCRARLREPVDLLRALRGRGGDVVHPDRRFTRP
jgi:hypothetical protein